LPVTGPSIEAEGVWENAHSITCTGTGGDPDAPPRLRARDLLLGGSGVFGIYEKCHGSGNGEVCRRIDMLVGANDATEHYGQYLTLLAPGRYEDYDGFPGRTVEVKPSSWTRADIKHPESP
jgi:hypothetical protein